MSSRAPVHRIPFRVTSNAQIATHLGNKFRQGVVCGLLGLFLEQRITAPLAVKARTEGSFVSEKRRRGNLACWLTRQCEGPWWTRMRTMSTSPRQAARCSGKHPLLSATFVDASNCSSFSTTSLRQTQSHINVLFLFGGGVQIKHA